jgi:hypothetical protein
MRLRIILVFAANFAPLTSASGQRGGTPLGESRQVLDTAFVAPRLGPATFPSAGGPRVVIDEAHHNFHTAFGRYRPFAKLLQNDGFRVAANAEPFSARTLSDAKVLVIANALNVAHLQGSAWKLPARSAFDDSEIAAIASWVHDGGALLLIADHMPFAGDAARLARALGIQLMNSFALLGDADPRTGDYPIVFRRSDGTLKAHAVTNGRNQRERIDSIESFTGSAFRLSAGRGGALMALPAATKVRMPAVAWQFDASTQTVSGAGLLQGAAISIGKGRVAIFGEAAMFTAQRKGAQSVAMGMNAEEAAQNPQFILNLMHWLVRIL